MSSMSEKMAAEEKHAVSTMKTWKRLVSCGPFTYWPLQAVVFVFQSLLVALPICGYLSWKHLIGQFLCIDGLCVCVSGICDLLSLGKVTFQKDQNVLGFTVR